MERTGHITGVNGNLITVAFHADIRQHELAYALLGDARLKAEVVRLRGQHADLQVFESTQGLRVGDPVEFSDDMLSVELGPGLLGQLYDGLQNPLHRLAEQHGFFLKRGTYLPGLDPETRWSFTPRVETGDEVEAGDSLGTVPEGVFEHRIMVPFDLKGRWQIAKIAPAESYTVRETIAVIRKEGELDRELTMSFHWPVKRAIGVYRERLAPTEPLITQIRLIDSLFPVAQGGTYCIPGPFGAGKTILQQITSRFARIDIVILAACGERAGEIVEIIRDFPELSDPSTDRPLMDRTVILCNTSSMPVAARESSVYTAVTLAEYYRQMGLRVLLLADSTSRWAQAMRERSGRLEEIPGEEAFPAYLESVIAEFYERAGRVRLKDGRIGSVTIGGTVSPAGGNFEEPVTQATLKVVGAFHALSRERSDARRYPAIDPLESWSRYQGIIEADQRKEIRHYLARALEIEQMMKVVGEEGTSLEDYVIHLKGDFFDSVYLQQNAFDPVDAATPRDRQQKVFALLKEILEAELQLKNREEARRFFNQLRQAFLDLNGTEWETPEFEEAIRRIGQLLEGKTEQTTAKALLERRQALVETDLDSSFQRSQRMKPRAHPELSMVQENEENQHTDSSDRG